MLEALEFARQVFETKVAPVLEKWGYSVSPLPQRNPYKVEWGVGESGGLKIELFADHRSPSDRRLIFYGGISRPMLNFSEKPLTEAVILSKLKYAVEAEIVWQCRRRLAELTEIVFYPQAKSLEWGVRGGKYYICSLSVSFRKATWRWNCESYPMSNPGVPNYEKGTPFQLTPTDKEPNPVSALLDVVKLSIAEALL